MLQRGSSDAAKRLRRAKSTTSVPKRPLHQPGSSFDHDSAHRTALTAATRAFERAGGNTVSQIAARNGGVGRSQSARMSRRSAEGFHFVRQGSRTSNKNRKSPGRTINQYSNVRKAKSSCQLTPTSHQTSVISSDLQTSPGTNTSISWETNQFAERFDGYGSNAGIRLRNANSSYVIPRRSALNRVAPASECSTRSQQASPRRVMVQRSSIRENQTDEAIIALARERYLKEHQDQTLKTGRPSVSSSLRARFLRSKRSSWLNSTGLSQEQPSFEKQLVNTCETEIRPEPRAKPNTRSHRHSLSFSSIKRGWKRAFGRSSSFGSELPPQHVESTQMHYGTTFVSPNQAYDQEFYGGSTDDWMLDRPPTPPPHLVGIQGTSSLDRSSQRSQTLKDRSRVTSWNDSTRQSTLMLHDLGHLPSIQERTDVQDVKRPPSEERSLNIPIRRSSSKFIFKELLDSRRLVSALMKHTKLNSGQGLEDEGHEDCSDPVPRQSGNEMQTPNSTDTNQGIHAHPVPIPFLKLPEPIVTEEVPMRFNRGNVVSPSVYSERPDSVACIVENSSTTDGSSSPAGTATVIPSHAIGRWHVGGHAGDNRQIASNEWRVWAADKSAGLDRTEEFVLPSFVPQIQQRLESTNSFNETSKALMRQNSVSLKDSQTQFNRQISLMNDRFPMLGAGRTASKSSLASSRRFSHSKMQSLLASNKQPLTSQEETNSKDGSSSAIFIRGDEKFTSDGMNKDKESNIAVQEISDKNFTSSEIENKDEHCYRPIQSNGLKSKVKCTERGSPLATRGPNTLDDDLLGRIRKGPYCVSTSSLARANTGSIDSIRLPKRQSPALSRRSNENTPPSTGQRMVNDFLRSRASNLQGDANSSSPAFL